jgi:hypothetical protein
MKEEVSISPSQAKQNWLKNSSIKYEFGKTSLIANNSPRALNKVIENILTINPDTRISRQKGHRNFHSVNTRAPSIEI